jgi:hypothetical protein
LSRRRPWTPHLRVVTAGRTRIAVFEAAGLRGRVHRGIRRPGTADAWIAAANVGIRPVSRCSPSGTDLSARRRSREPCQLQTAGPCEHESGEWSRHSDLNRGPAVYELDRPKRCGTSVERRELAAQLSGLRFELGGGLPVRAVPVTLR